MLGRVGTFELPTLGREVEIPVYMVHSSDDPEDYFFLVDFEDFVERSRGGIFLRPVLRIFAGRSDFSRAQFARAFRAVFATEFDRMRAELAAGKGRRGWLDWDIGATAIMGAVGGLVANLVLAVALQAGRSIFGQVRLPRVLRGKSAEARLSDEIERTTRQVETALERIEVTLHPELYDHAFRGVDRPPILPLDRDAWPLPDYVRTHLGDGESGSWW